MIELLSPLSSVPWRLPGCFYRTPDFAVRLFSDCSSPLSPFAVLIMLCNLRTLLRFCRLPPPFFSEIFYLWVFFFGCSEPFGPSDFSQLRILRLFPVAPSFRALSFFSKVSFFYLPDLLWRFWFFPDTPRYSPPVQRRKCLCRPPPFFSIALRLLSLFRLFVFELFS